MENIVEVSVLFVVVALLLHFNGCANLLQLSEWPFIK